MSLFDRVKAAKAQFKQRYDQRENTRAERNALELERLKAERMVLAERRATSEALANERREVRQLKYGRATGIVGAVAHKTANKVGGVLTRFHQESRVGVRQRVNETLRAGFDSPFSSKNLSRGLGGSPLTGQRHRNHSRKRKRGKVYIVRG